VAIPMAKMITGRQRYYEEYQEKKLIIISFRLRKGKNMKQSMAWIQL
jgi:hypothetical protein